MVNGSDVFLGALAGAAAVAIVSLFLLLVEEEKDDGPTWCSLLSLEEIAVVRGGAFDAREFPPCTAMIPGPVVTRAGQGAGSAYIKGCEESGWWTARGLPDGMWIDAATGAFLGAAQRSGIYKARITCTNSLGSETMALDFVVP